MFSRFNPARFRFLTLAAILTIAGALAPAVPAQGTVTGGFEGMVRDSTLQKPLPGARVILRNLSNETQFTVITDENGRYSRRSLPPGEYEIEVSATGYAPQTKTQTLYAMANYTVRPNPFDMVPTTAPVGPTPVVTPDPGKPPIVTPQSPPAPDDKDDQGDDGETLSLDTRRVGIFGADRVVGLPLGSTTLTRTFDELAFLVPGVYPAPQAIGNSVGPGVGGGVGTSGQFSVNGLRSRANNFTVDGSDNNDEDIGVRRQGFFTLVPQPIESIQEFQITTLLAPAEFGRNLGAQVNALSKSGGNRFHGSVFGFVNNDRLNARNALDSVGGNQSFNVSGLRPADGVPIPVFLDFGRVRAQNTAGEKDELSLFQGGAAIGGRIVRDKLFFFASGEGQELSGSRERSFAVPNLPQRGLFNSGVNGLQQCQAGDGGGVVNGVCRNAGGTPVAFTPGFPTSVGGDAVFSLFPFPNNPGGIYGSNTYTQELSTDAEGRIYSGKVDYLFGAFGQQQTLTARYNFTDDKRDLTDVGGALFSAIRPLVTTNNFSSYLAGGLTNNISNEFRFSFGRTELDFEELRDETGFLVPLSNSITNPRDRRFLINARLLFNVTRPQLTNCTATGCTAPGSADYITAGTTEDSALGPIGQLIIPGFSPVGVDVFNFPQQRLNDTFQFADTLRWQLGRHNLAFGADIRRVKLESDLPRNSRPLVTFNGAVDFRPNGGVFTRPVDLAAAGAATGFFQSLVLPGSNSQIELNYSQLNFFVQNEWRVRPNISLNFGVRYEYNTPPREAERKIENTFATGQSQFPGAVGDRNIFRGFQDFINGRTSIYDADKNNFAPRIGVAFGITDSTVIRGGYGIYYDQVIGSVVSQSRNVFPTFTTFNTAGGELACNDFFTLLNPISGTYSPTSCNPGAPDRLQLVQPGTLNTLNPAFDRIALLTQLLFEFPFEGNGTTFGGTLPARVLDTPFSHQYYAGIEQRITANTFLSAAYVGTRGRNLLRFTTPNLGSNFIAVIDSLTLNPNGEPQVGGTTFDPFSRASNLTRPNPNIGPINRFETTGRSQYHSLQLAVRGRLRNVLSYNANYTYGEVLDDVSDVFDLAGAPALPQNSLSFAGEYAAANFDVRHRFTYNFLYALPRLNDQHEIIKNIFGSWELAGTGKFNTGQPFTVNTLFDVNLDGNLTDRPNNLQFIRQTGDRSAPLQLTCATPVACQGALAAFGQDGSVPRNSFRTGNVLEMDMTLSRKFRISEEQNIQFRVDFFNFINRANFGVPVRFLEAPGFGRAVETITPGRRIQFALKYNF